MAIHDLQLLAALLGSGLATSILVGESDLPPIDVLGEEFAVVYADASSRGDPRSLDAYLVKLALLARRHWGRGVSERVLYPAPLTKSGEALPPLFLGKGSERVKQAATYIVELASLLAVSRNPPAVFGDEPERLLLVRHGPLLQMISQYTSEPFRVSTDEALRLLLYAGLERGDALELLEYSYECNPKGGLNRNRVVLGLLALALLSSLTRETVERSQGLAGMVEDVSRSRSLVSAVLARLLGSLRSGEGGVHVIGSLSARAVDVCTVYYYENPSIIDECFCPSIDAGQLLRSYEEWDRLLTAVSQVLAGRFGGKLEDAPLEEVEAAILWSGSMPEMADSELLYSLYYVLGGDYYPATRPYSHEARIKITRYYIGEFDGPSCHAGALGELFGYVSRIRYQYLGPVKPPSCSSLRSEAAGRGLSVRPCELAGLYAVPQAIRLEYVDGMPLLEHARALTVYPARIVLYGYPPQLLVVDGFSRITPAELAVLTELAESITRRVQPYSSFLRRWETRISSMI